MLLNALGEGLEGCDVLAGGNHLGDEEEANRRGQHVGSYAGEVVSVVLATRQLARVELAGVPVYSEGNGHHQQASLNAQLLTVA